MAKQQALYPQALYPRYWPLWVARFLGWLLINVMPVCFLFAIGRWLGRQMMRFSARRRSIAIRNLESCFPEWNNEERHHVLKGCFESVGMGLMETLMAWWLPNWRFKRFVWRFDSEDLSLIKRGLMLCGAHFSSMEMLGRYFGQRFGRLHLVYQPHKDPVINEMINRGRRRYTKGLVCRKDVRQIIRVLRSGDYLWYAPDQDLRAKVSVFVSFFHDLCATVKLTGALLRSGNADCVFVYFHRRKDRKGYALKFVRPDNYPSGDEKTDAITYNQALEAVVREHPEQYLWLHRRFKTRPDGEPPFYQ